MVRGLRRRLRHGRDQQHLLPPAYGPNLQGVARAGPGRISLRGQSEPVFDSSEKIEGGASATQEISGPGAALAGASGPYSLSTAAALAFEPGTIGIFPGVVA